MNEAEIIKAVNSGKVLVRAEFRSGEIIDRSGNKNGKAWAIKRARFNVEVPMAGGSRKPMVLEQRIPDNMPAQSYVFPKLGEQVIFELGITPSDKGAYYIDANPIANGKAS